VSVCPVQALTFECLDLQNSLNAQVHLQNICVKVEYQVVVSSHTSLTKYTRASGVPPTERNIVLLLFFLYAASSECFCLSVTEDE